MANKHVVRELQIKITTNYLFLPIRLLKIKKSSNIWC